MRNILGKCHCGNIEYEFVWPESGNEIPVRACSCTFCRKHSGVYTSHPQGQLKARVSDQSRVNKYAFGTKTAEFYICASCGVVPFATSKIQGKTYALVNGNTFEDVKPEDLVSSVTDVDSESIDGRLERRARNWIPQVTIK